MADIWICSNFASFYSIPLIFGVLNRQFFFFRKYLASGSIARPYLNPCQYLHSVQKIKEFLLDNPFILIDLQRFINWSPWKKWSYGEKKLGWKSQNLPKPWFHLFWEVFSTLAGLYAIYDQNLYGDQLIDVFKHFH